MNAFRVAGGSSYLFDINNQLTFLKTLPHSCRMAGGST